MNSRRQFVVLLAFCGAGVLGSAGCQPDEPTGSDADASDQQAPATKLVFPEEIRVADASVNTFVEHAMGVCSNPDYQAFRLLWSVREQPLTRDEFEEGWLAVKEIRVRALDKVKLTSATGQGEESLQTVYALYAEVALDPTHEAARKDPRREVVLMIVPEHGDWRLAKAPKRMRAWMTDKVKGSTNGAERPSEGGSAPGETG